MSSFGTLITKLQYVKCVAFHFGTPGTVTLILMPPSKSNTSTKPNCFTSHRTILPKWGVSPGRVTSTHNKRGCAILTKKVAPKNPGTYLKLRPKNPGTRNARLSVYMRKLTTQIRKSWISTPRFSFTYFIKGFYYLTFF